MGPVGPGPAPAAPPGGPLRVTHCPVNVAGIPWANVQALRRKGIEARLVVFERGRLHPEADRSLDRHGSLPRRLAQQALAFARLLPETDVFHFYFGLTLLPKSVQFAVLRATGRRSVVHWLGSDIRGKPAAELAWARKAGAQIVGSYDAIRWVGEAHVVPPGLDLREYEPRPPSERSRPLVVHAPSSRARKGTEHVIAACAQLPVDLDLVEGVPHARARERYARADIVVDQLRAGWHGVFALEAMALGKPVVAHLKPDVVERSAEAFGVRVPIVPATPETLVDVLRTLVEDPDRRRELGAAGRAYVERVHDIDRVADRLLDIYRSL
jgi:glycosyltransferase involved in cell wall biosynthesis